MPQRDSHPEAVALLKADHRAIEQLFRRFERSRGAADHKRLSDRIVRELSVHAAIEEELVYPALRGLMNGHPGDVLRALEEHHLTKVALSEIERLPGTDERLVPKVRVLIDAVRRHVEEEERTLLQAAQRLLDAGARQRLGEALVRAKAVAPTRPHPLAPDEPPANALANAGAAAYDRSREAVARGLARVMDLGRDVVEQALRRGEQVAREARQRLGRGLERAGRDVRSHA
jgi:hemerythrin superfamily protein